MGLWFVLSFFTAILFLAIPNGHCASIVGGRVAAPHSRPYMAAILGRKNFCGGTLIQPNWVLSAAHCDIQIGDKVILGAHSLRKPEKEKQEFQVTRVIPHKAYNQGTFEHDIMLLQLNGRARITNSVRLVRLPTTNEGVRASTQCLAVGWGRTATAPRSDVLREIDLTIFDRHVCQNAIPINHLCAGLRNQRGNACSDDSGGPLICQGIQRGITSFRLDAACQDPSAYTHLSKNYIRWIRENIRR